MGDPSGPALLALNSLNDVAEYVGLQGIEGDLRTPKGALFLQLGAQADTSPALLATFTETEFNDLISFWKIATSVDASGVVTEERRPNAIETGAARFFGRICRLRLGVQSAGHATPAGSVPPSGSTVASRKLKLSQIISQVDETEIEPLSESDVLVMFARYETLFGKGQRPPSNREPTAEQLAALRSLLNSQQVPYCDFAIYGPHGTRITRKLKFSGLVLNKNGELVQSEIYGPSSLEAWKVSYGVFLNSMIMLDAADLGPLLQYQARVERMLEFQNLGLAVSSRR